MAKCMLSVIIPNYNKVSYVGQLLEQLKTQLTDEVEVIVVDDCSTDNSLEVINQYKDIFKIITHDTNQYVCRTRNDGVDEAKGKYITFIDSDDLIEDNFISTILSHIKTNKDAYFFDYNIIDLDGEYITDITKGNNTMVWSKVYKRGFLSDNNIRFKEGLYRRGVLDEDYEFNMHLLSLTQKVDILKDKIIKYRFGVANSISNSTQILEAKTEFDSLSTAEFMKKWFRIEEDDK